MIEDTTEVKRRIGRKEMQIGDEKRPVIDVQISAESYDDEVARETADEIAQAVREVIDE